MTRSELLQIAKPILFNTDMARAILDGRKMVTRRVIKPQPKMKLCYFFAGYGHGRWGYPDENAWRYWGEEFRRPATITKEDEGMLWTPPCHTDDILYVRETWCSLPVNEAGHMRGHDTYYYRADGDLRPVGWKGNWRPSINMPKKAARIFLRITDVEVEPLQDMGIMDLFKEGVHTAECVGIDVCGKGCKDCFGIMKNIWNSTIKKSDLDRYGWCVNPLVWVIEFERINPDV